MSALDYLKDYRILVLLLIVVALVALDVTYGIHFGIEFSGGTQIPLTLEHSVNTTTMATLIADLQQRVSTFGLKQVSVEGVGSSVIYITVPTISPTDINQTINVIESQGRFLGVVNGKEALNGTNILKGSVGSLPPQQLNGTVSWAVQFYITQSSTAKFAKAVFGEADKPLYMFLDRPVNAAMVVNQSILANKSLGLTAQQSLAAMEKALALGNQTIPVMTFASGSSSSSSVISFFKAHPEYRTALASYNIDPAVANALEQMNVTVKLESDANMTPQYFQVSINNTEVNSWPLVGLLSSPILNASITNGSVGDSYQISGFTPPSVPSPQQYSYAQNQEKTITSILNGGALPVSVIVGNPTSIPATLGQEALYVSGVALLLAVVALTIFITVRYRRPFLVLPILLTTFLEVFIIISILGTVGTIDLSGVAGIIAVVGTGVDAQIIITDEMLLRGTEHSTAKGVLGSAFTIVWIDALLLVGAMLPLFFSTSLVTVIGFSEATIIGALLGVLVTRPAYGALISRHFSH